MSYIRFGEDGSDVYVYLSTSGHLECSMCPLQKREQVEDPNAFLGFYLKSVEPVIQTEFDNTADMLAHLELHIAAGHCVPPRVMTELRADAEENDDWMRAI